MGNSEKSNVLHLACSVHSCVQYQVPWVSVRPEPGLYSRRALNNKHKSDGYRIIIIRVVKSKVDACRYLLRSILVATRGQRLSIASRFHGPSRPITITGFTVTQPSYPWKQSQERDGLAFQWQAPSWTLGPTGRNETLPCEA